VTIRVEELDRDGVVAHLDALARLLLNAHTSGMSLGLAAPLSIEGARDAYVIAADKLEPGERLLLGAFDGDELVGAVQLDRSSAGNGRHRAEVRRLVVRTDRRGAGVGRALMDAVVDTAGGLGLRLLWLTTHEGTDADRFYGRLGWSRVGVIPDYAELPNGELAGNTFYFLQVRA
jgi:GNAT superfamily N-acetyltransferase